MATDSMLAGLDALDAAAAGRGAGAAERARRVWAVLWPKLAAIALVWVIWELILLSGWKNFVLPGPGVTLSNLWEQAKAGLLWHAIGDTVLRALIGYAVALAIGVVTGLLVARIPPLRAAVGSLITGLQTLPSAAWIPFAIILFGLNNSAIVFIIVMASAPAIANGVIAGADYIPPLLLKAGKVIGLRGLALTWHLIMPAALPTFMASLKQAWAFTWHALLTAELLVLVAGEPSIGQLFSADQDQTDMPSTIAVMIVILILGILVDAAYGLANSRIRKRWGIAG
ncbi:MAG TPA: ABC transporter permease subunit [Trebonia sp.]|nr:ABC transporter permease subunit [Trebonia sp.]